MGFYGNISSVNKSTFQFDKIYSNRAEMEDNCKDDGIFIGRYVLVDYDQELSGASILTTLMNEGTIGEEALGLIGYQVKIKSINEETQEEDIIDLTHITLTSGLNRESEYTLEDSRINDALNEGKDVYCVVIGYLIGEQIAGTIDFNYSLNTNIVPSLYKASIATESENTEQEYLEWILVQNLNDLDIKTNSYLANYRIDAARFPNLGRGWDSTVWQKTYKNNEATYVMIAELNSVVPTFDVTTDAPTEIPLKPHYDTDTSNIYYRLHMQPSWGMRVRASDGTFSFDNAEYPSDVKGNFIIDQKLRDGNARSRETGYYPDNIWKDSHILEQKVVNKDLAIYFNKDGFNKKFPHFNENNEDVINMMPTGYSTNKYYSHKIEDENGNTIREEELVPQQYPDTYELSIMLPSIGNTISKIWDIVYGEGAIYDTFGRFLWDKETKTFTQLPIRDNNGRITKNPLFMRNTAIEWNTNTGIRMNRGVKVKYNENTKKDEKEVITYNKEALNSIAGIINTVHDLMGMIIIERDESPGATLGSVAKWDPEKIYYIDGKYYYKAKAHDFIAYAPTDGISGSSIKDITISSSTSNTDSDGKVEIIEKYFRESEETYDDYNTLDVNGQPTSSIYHNYYKVNQNYFDIIEGATYGELTLLHLPNLSFENYSDSNLETDDIKLYYYTNNPSNTALGNGYVLADVNGEEKVPKSDVDYYKMKFVPVEAGNLEYYYVPNIYWVGIKTFRTENELNAWNQKNNINNLTEEDFDSLRQCTEDSVKLALATEGISWDDETNQITNNGNGVFRGYKFLLGVQLNPSESTYVLRDSNIIDETYTQTSVGDNLITRNIGDEGYSITFAGITETLQNVEVSTVEGGLLKYDYRAARYYNTKNLDENDKIKTTEIKTLLGWQIWAVENNKNINTDVNLIRSTRLIRVITEPAYTIQGAKIIPEFTLSPDNNGYVEYYYHPSLTIVDGREDKNNMYVQENITDLNSEYGNQRIAQGEYFRIAEQSTSFIYFNPQENYYYKDELGNYLKENNEIIKEENENNNNLSLANIYYKLKKFQPLSEGDVPFIPNMYQEVALDVNGKPRLDENGNIILSPIENFAEINENKKYQLYEDLFVKPGENGAPADKNGIFAAGAKWNMNVPIPKYEYIDSETGDTVIVDALTLSRKTNVWEARELKDFGNILNTINGLIVKINQKLLSGNLLTRDQQTVQGAINTLNDIIDKFNILIPGEFTMVDTYGRVHSGDWDSKQKSNTQQGTAPEIPTGEPEAADNNRWIKITTSSGTSPDFKPHIKLEHTFKAGIDTTSTSNLNTDNVTSNNNSDKIQLYTPILDNMGHVVAKNIETVTLPYGFKTVTAEGGNQLIADNTQDDIYIAGDSWIEVDAHNTSLSGVYQRGLSLFHDYPINNGHSTVSSETPIFGGTFTIQDLDFDDRGHKSNQGTHTITIPRPTVEYAKNAETSQEIPGNVLIGLSVDSTTNNSITTSNGVFTATKAYASSITLGNYADNHYRTFNNNTTIGGALDSLVGRLDTLEGGEGVEGSVSRKILSKIQTLDADLDASGTAQNNGIFVISGITETDGILTGIDSVEVDAAGAAATALETAVGSSEDTETDDTIYGAKAYAKAYTDEQIEAIEVSYIEDPEDPNAVEETMSLNELFAYIKSLEARIAALEPQGSGGGE